MSAPSNRHGYARVVRALADRGPVFASIDLNDSLNEQALARVRRMLADDAVAATMVAATINTRQAAGESGPAFVKRIALALLDEMAGGR